MRRSTPTLALIALMVLVAAPASAAGWNEPVRRPAPIVRDQPAAPAPAPGRDAKPAAGCRAAGDGARCSGRGVAGFVTSLVRLVRGTRDGVTIPLGSIGIR